MSDVANAATTEEEQVQGDETEASTVASATEAEETQEELKDGQPSQDEGTKKKSGFARRAEKLMRQQEELEAELSYWRNLALESGKVKEPEAKVEPKLEDFDSVQEFIAARDTWLEERLLEKVTNKVSTQTSQQKALDTHNKRVEAAKKELADWEDVFDEAGDMNVPPDTAQFILESDVGPKIAYHLAKNPSDLERLQRLSPTRRLAELGKLEDRLAKPAAPKKVSAAPAKLAEVKGGSDAPATGKPRSYSEWKANRARQAG